jgi:hypothetical protein
MGRRFSGLLLMLRALAPLLSVLIVGLTLSIILGDVRAVAEKPIQTIQDEIGEIRGTVDSIRDDIETVNDDITALVDDLTDFNLPNLIPNIPGTLSFPSLDLPSVSIPIPTVSVRTSNFSVGNLTLSYPSGLTIGSRNFSLNIPNIPGFSVPLPGLGQLDDALRTALSPLTGIFDTFNQAFSSIGMLNITLQRIPDHFTTITDQGEQLILNLWRTVAGWGQTLLIVIGILLALVVIFFGVGLLDDLTRGWHMLLGRPAE